MKEKLDSAEVLNDKALEILGKGDFLTAQVLFRQNVQNNPCFISLNNLGAFYICEGMSLPNGRVRSASKLGLKYLKKAETYSQSHINLMAIGEVYFKMNEYKVASDYFRRACKLSNSYICFNNLGVSLYMQNEYEEASKNFEKALNHYNDFDNFDLDSAKSTIYFSYAFSLLQYDINKCRAVLTEMVNSDIDHIEKDEFILAYLCDYYQLAESIIKKTFDSWHFEPTEIAMVFDCLFKLKQDDKAKEYLRHHIELLEEYEYNTRKEINSAKQAFSNQDYRKKTICEYRYIPPIINYCYYAN